MIDTKIDVFFIVLLLNFRICEVSYDKKKLLILRKKKLR